MSSYVTRRNSMVDAVAREYDISDIEANQLVTEWEYEANRQGLDQRQEEFWRVGRVWMADAMTKRAS